MRMDETLGPTIFLSFFNEKMKDGVLRERKREIVVECVQFRSYDLCINHFPENILSLKEKKISRYYLSNVQ